jgi:hypothetical protein
MIQIRGAQNILSIYIKSIDGIKKHREWDIKNNGVS